MGFTALQYYCFEYYCFVPRNCYTTSNERQRMKLNIALKTIFLTLFFLINNNLFAQTMDTNIKGLVIKNYKCIDSGGWYVQGILVNRNVEPFGGKLRAKIIDSDNDILWQGAQNINVAEQNGTNFWVKIVVGSCLAPNKVQITLER